jgi:hypothetical protein
MTTGARPGGAGPSESAPADPDPRVAAALARSDRYLVEFVEQLALCPWARSCREGGRLQRRVLLVPGGAPGSAELHAAVLAADAAVAAVEALPPDSVEVALLIFPALVPALAGGAEAPLAFERFCNAVRAATLARLQREPPFFCVPFHPDFPEDLATPARAVRFIRRSPDPTLQLVRASVLHAVRGPASDKLVVDPARLTAAQLASLQPPESVSDRIARVDLEALRTAGVEGLRALLGRIRHG